MTLVPIPLARLEPLSMIRLFVTADLAQDHALALDLGQSRYLTAVMRREVGDEVLVELTPYDLTKGRITYRFK